MIALTYTTGVRPVNLNRKLLMSIPDFTLEIDYLL